MSIPKFHEIMLPLLKMYSDGQIHHRKEFLESISTHFNLIEEDKNEKVKSGWSRIWDRTSWALQYLFKAGFLCSPSRGYFQITERGQEVLSRNLESLTLELIKKLYPDVLETTFFNPELATKKEKNQELNNDIIDSEQTPDELLEGIIDQKLVESYSEIQDQIKNISPRAFEFLVNKLLIAMGYGTEEFSKTTSFTNDGGIDGIIQADELGFDKIYVQAKKYEGNVGRPDIQKFVGAMTGTNKGVFITTSSFASSVKEYLNSRQENVMLIDGTKLIELMYKHNQGVSVRRTIEIKTLDSDYFEELE